MRFTDHDRESFSRAAIDEWRRHRKQPSGQARWKEIQDIVKTRRGPAESRMSFCAMADHGIGRIDHLVDEKPRQAEERQVKGRRDDSIAEIFRAGFNRGAADCRLVESLRIAPDDTTHSKPPGSKTFSLQSLRNVSDMFVKASLRQKERSDKRLNEEAAHKAPAQSADDPSGKRCRRYHCCKRQNAKHLSPAKGKLRPVPARVEKPNQPSHKDHGMRQPAPQPVRVADRGIER